MLINNLLEESARRYPNKIALITSEGRYSYQEIDDIANKVAQALQEEGLEKGDRIAIFMDNSMEAVVSLFGILKAGGIFLIVNPTTKREKLTYILNNCRVSSLVGAIQNISIIKDVCNDTVSLRSVYLTGNKYLPCERLQKKTFFLESIFISSEDKEYTKNNSINIDVANISYTSGSSGTPKGVMMTHLNMISAVESITTYLENSPGDIILSVLPMSFDYGLYQVLMAFKVGASVILKKSCIYPYNVIDTMLTEKVTGFPVVPTILAMILQMEDIKKHKFDCLRYISNTAAALPVTYINQLKVFFPKTKIYSMYGLTECKRVAFLPPEQISIRPTSVGKAMPNTEVYIVDESSNRVSSNVIGELVVRGANVMRGYWEMPEETAKVLRPGPYPGEMVLYTGDLFKMDEDGYLYFIDRKDDIIKSRGEKVSPKEVENVLYGIDDIIEAAVIGVPDVILGATIKAFVVLKRGSDLREKDIQKYCSAHLEDLMVPKFVEFRGKLPKTKSGKIDKKNILK